MKSPFHFSLASVLALLLLLAGCGQKGPLYLPKPPPERAVRTVPAEPAADSDVTPVTPVIPGTPAK